MVSRLGKQFQQKVRGSANGSPKRIAGIRPVDMPIEGLKGHDGFDGKMVLMFIKLLFIHQIIAFAFRLRSLPFH